MTSTQEGWRCHKCHCHNSGAAASCWNCHTRPSHTAASAVASGPGSLRALLENYVGASVQINFRDRQRAETAQLTQIQGDYFSVSDPDSGEHYHFPLRYLVSARESAGAATGQAADLLLEVHRSPPDGERADA
jgi:hypothetical protein